AGSGGAGGAGGSGRGSCGSERTADRLDGIRAGAVCDIRSIVPGYPAGHRSCTRAGYPPSGPRTGPPAHGGPGFGQRGDMDTIIEPPAATVGPVTPRPDPERPANPEEEPVFPGPEPVGPDPDRPVHTDPEPAPSVPPPPGFDPEAPDPENIPEPPEPAPRKPQAP